MTKKKNRIPGIENLDFSSVITVSSYTSCHESGRCDDYCRCSTYDGIREIDASDRSYICRDVCDEFEIEDEIDKYVVDRILKNMGGYDCANYDYTASYGYYGEELDNVYFDNESDAERIRNGIEHLKELETVKEKIEFALVVEYGYVLEHLKDVEYELKEISPHKIEASTPKMVTQMSNWMVRSYAHSGPEIRGIVRYLGKGRYRVVDGNHRVAASKIAIPEKGKGSKETIKVFVVSA